MKNRMIQVVLVLAALCEAAEMSWFTGKNSHPLKRFFGVLLLGTALSIAIGSMSAQADVPSINIQFGSGPIYTGSAVIGAGGDQWNHVGSSGAGMTLFDVTGTVSAVTLTWDSGGNYDFSSAFNSTAYASLMNGYIYSTLPATITFSGLTPDSAYDLYIYTQADVGNRQLTVAVNGGAPVTTSPSDIGANTFIEGQNYLKLSGTVDGAGQVVINYSPATGEANINGMQLVNTSAAPAIAPTATTGAASPIMASAAQLNGTVNDNGADTTVSFEYGLTSGYGSTATAYSMVFGPTIPAGSGSSAVYSSISGLTCNTAYNYRLVAVNSAGTTNGENATFTTSDCPEPNIAVLRWNTRASDPGQSGNSISYANTTRKIAVAPNGTIYVVYHGTNGVRVAKSTDSGQSFGASVQVGAADSEAEVAVASTGYVYVAWNQGGNAYVSRSTDSGATFGVPVNAGNAIDTIHMATDGGYVYLIDRPGNNFMRSSDGGQTFGAVSINAGQVFSDVHVDPTTHEVIIQVDDPAIKYYVSSDFGATFSAQITPSPGGSVWGSVGALSSGVAGRYLLVAGSNASNIKVNLADNLSSTMPGIPSSLSAQGRSLSTDRYGNVLTGVSDGINVSFAYSNDMGATFSDVKIVGSGAESNAAINTTNGDALFIYQTGGEIFVATYNNLLAGYTLNLSTSNLTFLSSPLTQGVTVTNANSSAASIDTIVASGDGFSQTSDCPTSLAAGASCQISVTYGRTSAGQQTGTISVTYNGSENRIVSLSAPELPVKTVTASVGSGTGTISPSGVVTVATGSTQDFTLTPGSGFLTAGVDGTCGGAMINATTFRTNAVNADCTVIAVFAVGGADIPVISVAATLNFGAAPFGNGYGSGTVIRNVTPGTARLNISSMALTDSSLFTLRTDIGCGTTPSLGAGESCVVSVDFTPPDNDPHSTHLLITSNDPATPVKDVLVIANYPVLAPTATTGAASPVSTTTAQLNGMVNDNYADTTVSFEYGLTSGYGSTAPAYSMVFGPTVPAGSGSTAVYSSISGLTCNTAYNYRLVAVNSAGTTNGENATFTTAACPGPNNAVLRWNTRASDLGQSGNSITQANTTRKIAVAPNGTIYIVYHGTNGVRVAKSTDNGLSFGASVQVSAADYEAEIAVASTGYVYVAWADATSTYVSRSTDGGITFAAPVNAGSNAVPMIGNNSVHMATDGGYIYLIDKPGNNFLRSSNGGQTFGTVSINAAQYFSDVHVEPVTHEVIVQVDDPEVKYYVSSDNGATFSARMTPVQGGNVNYSVGALSSGSGGRYLLVAGAGTTSVKVNLTDNTSTSMPVIPASPASQGRSLSTDRYGNVLTGVSDNTNVSFAYSNNLGTTFSDVMIVGAGTESNAAINTTNGDALFVYQNNGEVFVAVYNNILVGYSLNLSTSNLTFLSSPLTQIVTVTNANSSAATIDTIVASGDGFSQTSDCPTSLAAGASCQISVTYGRTSAGQQTGTISVTYNGSENRIVSLSAPELPVKSVTASVGSGTGTINPSGVVTVATSSTQDFTLTPGFGFLTAGVDGTCGGAMINATTFRTNAVVDNCSVVANFIVNNSTSSVIQLPRTGQNVCFDYAGAVIDCGGTGQDGDLKKGVAWPDPRFTNNNNGTVTDNLTGLTWLQNANCFGTNNTWQQSLDASNTLAGNNSQCSLNDNSQAGEWRMPNLNELKSLMDLSQFNPSLPAGQPFTDIQARYWSSTTAPMSATDVYAGFPLDGYSFAAGKQETGLAVWPVRGTSAATVALPQTGQTSCWDANGTLINCSGTGQDGDKQKGAVWPTPRMADNGNGTLTDNLTGLVWLKNASCFNETTWEQSLLNAKALAGNNTVCGLSDGSTAGQWRVPNRAEMESLGNLQLSVTTPGQWHAYLGFTNINEQNPLYWTSSSMSPAMNTKMINYLAYAVVMPENMMGPTGQSYYSLMVRDGVTLPTTTPQTISFGAVPNITYGGSAGRVDAIATSGLAVTLTSLTTDVCTLSDTMVVPLSAGQCRIEATQGGDATYSAAAPVVQIITVGAAVQAISVTTVAPVTAENGSQFTVAATAPGGAVSYSSGSPGICSNNGATFTINAPSGSCVVRYDQAGSSNFMPAAQVSSATVVGTAVSVTVSGGTLTIVPGAAAVVVDAAVQVLGSVDITDAKVTIGSGFDARKDTLGFDAGSLPPGVTGIYDGAKGILTFKGTATTAQWQALFRTVTIASTTASATSRDVTFSLSSAVPNKVSGLDHFYEFVSASRINWATANSRAADKRLFGLQGYLATITSAAENDFIVQKVTGTAWIGATDEWKHINTACGSSVFSTQGVTNGTTPGGAEGHWYWVTGPEKCTNFSNSNTPATVVPGSYMNWDKPEPNNMGGEHYAHILSWTKPAGRWNDLADSGGSGSYASTGYVVEYGGMAGDPVVSISGSRSVAIQSRTVTPSATGNGSISPATPQAVIQGKTASFVITPATGYRVETPTGGTCAGTLTGNSYVTAAINADCTVAATFTPIIYTVTPQAGIGGSISPATPTAAAFGSTQQFTISADSGKFVYAVSGCGGSWNSTTGVYTTASISGNCSVNVSFDPNSRTVSGSATGNGSVICSPGIVSSGNNSSCSVSAGAGSHLVSLTDNGANVTSSVSNGSYTISNVTGNRSIAAIFSENAFTVTPIASSGASFAPNSPQRVASGNTISFNITPQTGYELSSVGGSCGGTLDGFIYTTDAVNADCSVMPTFSHNNYTVTPAVGANGAISPNTPLIVSGGDTKLFTITPDSAYHIDSVTGCNGILSGNSYMTGAVGSDCAIETIFARNSYPVSVSRTAGGSVTPEGPFTVIDGDPVTLTAVPEQNFFIQAIVGCGVSYIPGSPNASSYDFTTAPLTGACDIAVSFDPTRFAVVGEVNGHVNGGSIDCSPKLITSGQSAVCTVTPPPGYRLATLTDNGADVFGSVSGSAYTVSNPTTHHRIAATFAQNQHTVTAGAVGGGSISPNSSSVLAGNMAAFVVTPDPGNSIVSVTETCAPAGQGGSLAGNVFTSGAVMADCSVTATFTAQQSAVTTVAGTGGSIEAGALVTNGGSLSITVTPDSGYRVASVLGCGGNWSGASPYLTGAVSADCTVAATFEKMSYWVTVQQGGHGSVVCTSPVESGATVSCTIKPDSYFTVQSTSSSCGGSYSGNTAGGTYVTNAVNADCSVTVSFVSVPPASPYNIEIRTPTVKNSLTVTWNTPLDPVYAYSKIYRSTVAGEIGTQVGTNITTVSFTDSGLAANTLYYYLVRSVSIDGVVSGNTLQVSGKTMADVALNTNEVSGLTVSDTTQGGELLLSWNYPVFQNSAGVHIYRSTQNGQLGDQIASGLLTTYRDAGLTNGSTYYYTIKTIDTFAQESTGVVGSQIPSNSVPPLPVNELKATLLADGQVTLSWTRSASGDVASYNIYGDGGSGIIDYGVSIGRVDHPATSWTSTGIASGAYRFGVRSEDSSGTLEYNTDRVIGVQTLVDPIPVTAVIPDAPKTGETITGATVSVSARLNSGSATDITGVSFQYRTASGGAWTDITTVATAPYGASWDTSLLAEGAYHMRAVATGSNTIPADENIFITVTVSPSASVSEQLSGGNKQRIQAMQPTAPAEIIMTGGDGKGTMRVAFQEGAIITGGTVTITDLNPTTQAPPVPVTYGNPQVFRAINIGGGMQLEDRTTTVELPYLDVDNDGIVDGTSLRAADLKVCHYTGGAWACLDSFLDTANKRVRAHTPGFSDFGLLAPPVPVSAGWNFLSVPLTPTTNTVASVFGSATAYTSYTNRWDAIAQTWAPATTVVPGQGYIVWGSGVSGAKLTVAGTETADTPQTITLRKGWNLIGHPYRYRVNVADLTITNGGSTLSLQDAQSNGWVAATAYKYAGGSYQYQTPTNGGTLEPWVAYWILSDVACTLNIPNTQAQ